jgi:hypothetical protein
MEKQILDRINFKKCNRCKHYNCIKNNTISNAVCANCIDYAIKRNKKDNDNVGLNSNAHYFNQDIKIKEILLEALKLKKEKPIIEETTEKEVTHSVGVDNNYNTFLINKETKEIILIKENSIENNELTNIQTELTLKKKVGRPKKSIEEKKLRIRKKYPKKPKTLKDLQKGRFYQVRKSAKDRNKPFDLTFEEFIQFWQVPCYYCGSAMKGIGLDRVDNTKGYLLDNVVPCCRLCNTIKGVMSLSEFVNHIRKILTIYDHRMLAAVCNSIKNISPSNNEKFF